MARRRSVLGAIVLCALALAAIGASNASAKAWYTCEEVAPNTGGFTDNHCSKKGLGNWSTVKIKSFPTLVVKTMTGPWKLESTIAGVKVAITCAEMNGSSNLTGEESEGEEVDELVGCEVSGPEGCKVKGGGFTTNKQKTTVLSETKMKVGPQEGTTIATITLEGCKAEALNGARALTGSVTGEVPAEEPASLAVTSGSELKFGGATVTAFECKTHRRMFGTTSTVAWE
jgi:hypothetical protein